jgi:flagellar biosynthesis/type III secretory pathway protein FliH
MGHIERSASSNDGRVAAATVGHEEMVALLARVRAEAKASAVVLARKMAEKIVGHAVAVDAQVMRDIVAQAMATAKPGPETVTLRIHPEDLASLERARGAWLAELGTQADVRLVGDESVGRHGCVVETSAGRLDARLVTQLDAMERALLGARVRET